MKPQVGGLYLVQTKLRREIEPRWVSEFVMEHYPDDPASFRVPLGPIPQQLIDTYGHAKARRVYRPSRPEADAIVFLEDRLILIEGKIFKIRDGMGALTIYRGLIPKTPELADHHGKRVICQLLVVRPLPWITDAAEAADVQVVRYAPQWIQEIWEERDKYWTREAVRKREQRKEALRRLGYT